MAAYAYHDNLLVCALAAFVVVYVVVAIAKPGSRAQRDVLATVTGVGVVTSAPTPAATITKATAGLWRAAGRQGEVGGVAFQGEASNS